MSEQPKTVSPGLVFAVEAPTTTSVWLQRAGYYAAQAVANAERAHQRGIERRLDKPSRRWTAREVIRSYRVTADGARRYREEAEVLTQHGYRGWLETKRTGHPFGGQILMGLRLVVPEDQGARRSSSTRTVTWTKETTT